MAASDAFYLDIVTQVEEVISEFGTTYQVKGKGVYDSTTRTTSKGSERTVSGLVANQQFVDNLGSQAFAVNALSHNWSAKASLIMAPSAAPLPHEDVYVDGQWYPFSKVQPIKPADVVVVYLLDVSR